MKKSAQQRLQRIILLFMAGILFSCSTLFANPKPHEFFRDEKTNAPSGWVLSIYSVFAYMHYPAQPGALDISFPYKLSKRNNLGPPTVTNATFSSHSDDLVGHGKFVYPALAIELGKENFTVEAQTGIYLQHWSDNLYGGINYRFILRKAHRNPDRITLGAVSLPGKQAMHGGASFPVKISAGLFYYQPIWNLGNISVGDKQFDALGYTMQSMDSSNLAANGNVTVYYHQNILAFRPTFSIGFRPDNNRLDICFAASPMFLLTEVGGLRFYLTNNGLVDWVPRDGIDVSSVIPLDTQSLNATFKGEKISHTPFHLQGVMFTLKIGIRII